MLGQFCKKCFSLRKFFPIKEDPSAFIICQWQTDKTKPNLKYLTYRTIIALTFFITWILSMVEGKPSEKWPIFLTNWGYTLCTLQALLAVFMLASCTLAPRIRGYPNLKHDALNIYPVYWILNILAMPSAFGISLIYWIVLYDASIIPLTLMNYFVHGNNSILMMIDLWMVSHPTRIQHCVYPAVFAVIYTLFSLVYFLFGGTGRDGSVYIYKIVNWEKPIITILVCLAVVFFQITLHIIVFAISKARIMLYRKCCSKKHTLSMMDTKLEASYVNEGISSAVELP